jgi:hypothetical protein
VGVVRRTKKRRDSRGNLLRAGVYEVTNRDGELLGYKARWREQGPDEVTRQASKSFLATEIGSLDQALTEASLYREQALRITKAEGAALREGPASTVTVNELFGEWCVTRGPQLSVRYAEKVVRYWDREVASRRIGRVKLEALSRDPGILTRFQDELAGAGLTVSNRAEVLKALRAVLRWGRRRHPAALRIDLAGLFEIPSPPRTQLAFASDAYGLERIIEAVLAREARDDLLPLRDAAFVAALGFSVATRPSEWLYSARWSDLRERSVELQRPGNSDRQSIGLKTGARAALVLSNARERLATYKAALEDRFGAQPDEGLVFQALGQDGPLWSSDAKRGPEPLAWDYNAYKRWTARVWRPARLVASRAPGAPVGLEKMRFYDCRHSAISMALHSTLVMSPHGMNLHTLAGWAGHDVQTLQRHYAHVIARYYGAEPVELEAECAAARARVDAEPFRL